MNMEHIKSITVPKGPCYKNTSLQGKGSKLKHLFWNRT